jgi:hypothetical protein
MLAATKQQLCHNNNRFVMICFGDGGSVEFVGAE